MMTMQTQMVNGLIEVSYSPERKSEMATVNEKNCSLLINLLKHDLEKSGAKDIRVVIPKGKHRFADIIFEFHTPSEEHLIKLGSILTATAGSSVDRIAPFVVE